MIDMALGAHDALEEAISSSHRPWMGWGVVIGAIYLFGRIIF